MKKYNYKQHRLYYLQDIDTLVEAIHQNGNFTSEDYDYFYAKAISSRYPTRLISRLKRYIEPLICISQKPLKKVANEPPIVKEEEESPISPFERTYKASDFLVTDGCIQLGKLKLKSVRIPSTSPSILAGIDHDFVIAPIASKPDAFHFVPYTDLSFLLDAIDWQIHLEEKRKKQREIEKLKKQLPKLIIEYLFNYKSEYRSDFNAPYDKVKRILKCTYSLSKDEDIDRDTYDSLNTCRDVQVPIEDLEIEDGYVTVYTHNLTVSSSMDAVNFVWNYCGDYELLNELDDELINFWFKICAEEYCKTLHPKEVIKIKTFLSINSFKEAFLQRKSGSDYDEYPYAYEGYFKFPSEYLSNDYNVGWELLSSVPIRFLFDFITSEHFTFPKKVMNKFNKMLAKMPEFPRGSQYVEYWIKRDVFVRKLTNFHLRRVCIWGSVHKHTRVFVFSESYAHKSQDYASEINSYILIDDKYHFITLSPACRKYSNYSFKVDTNIVSLDVAALVIMKYFSFPTSNKRENFEVTDEMKYFGIKWVHKARGEWFSTYEWMLDH